MVHYGVGSTDAAEHKRLKFSQARSQPSVML